MMEALHFPPPLSGLNTISPQMAADECIRGYNTVPCEWGVRNRSGYKEWVTGLTGSADNAVRTLIPFSGSSAGDDRIFAATSSGIWNVSDSTTSPSIALAFLDTSGEAGYGVSTVMVTAGAHFCVYCDEQNGLYVYDERTGLWVKTPTGVNQDWESSRVCVAGDFVISGGNVYKATTSATSGSTAPTGTDLSVPVSDGGVDWLYLRAHVTNSIGPSLADQHGATVFDTGNMVFPVAFKNRLWFVERGTGRAWYLPINSVYGMATSFNMGTKFQHGGSLVAMYDWTMDGGAGPDDYLVAVSGGGDVLIYRGSDPSIDMELNGVWYVGAMLRGRKIATNFGGDLLLMSKSGIQSLSTIVVGKVQADKTQYPSFKISPLFNSYASLAAGFHGWSVNIMPEDSVLIITVPVGEGLPTKQLAMGLTTKGWYEYPYDSTGIPMFSTEVWEGTFFFGSVDGKVYQHTGWLDNITLSSPATGTPIQARFITGFQDFGNALQKQVHEIRTTFMCDAGAVGVNAAARYNYDLTELGTVTPANASGGWDGVNWDVGVWGADYTPQQTIIGAIGLGTQFAIAVRWAAVSKTIFTGMDVMYEQGGLL